jgi:hypothetical protein
MFQKKENKNKQKKRNKMFQMSAHLLENEDHLLDVPGRDEVHGQRQGLAAHLQVRRAEHAEDVHHDLLQDLLVLRRVLENGRRSDLRDVYAKHEIC